MISLPENLPEPEHELDQQVLDNVREHGWHVIAVLESEEGPAFVVTVGLYHTFQQPEIIVVGLPIDVMEQMINNACDLIKNGSSFREGEEAADILPGYSVCFKGVAQMAYDDYFGTAYWFYREEDFPVYQCVWPDREKNFPWQIGYLFPDHKKQPLLFEWY